MARIPNSFLDPDLIYSCSCVRVFYIRDKAKSGQEEGGEVAWSVPDPSSLIHQGPTSCSWL